MFETGTLPPPHAVFASPGGAGAGRSVDSKDPSLYSPAVVRSNELLSCARTALKMMHAEYRRTNDASLEVFLQIQPSHLQLAQCASTDATLSPLRLSPRQELLEDGLSLLRTMEAELSDLEALVRRQGQTNDPTQEIAKAVQRLERDTKELTEFCQHLVPAPSQNYSQQYRKHCQVLQEWFQGVAQKQGERLQDLLKIRSKVLTEQARRRQQFQAKPSSGKGNTATSKAMLQRNPLFQRPVLQQPKPAFAGGTTTPPGAMSSATPGASSVETASHTAFANNGHAPLSPPPPTKTRPFGIQSSVATRPSAGGYGNGMVRTSAGYGGAAARPYYGGQFQDQWGNSSSAGYGGGYGGGTGMRHRKSAATSMSSSLTSETTSHNTLEQEQLLVRRQERESQQRLQEARETEKALASLGKLFGDMLTLVSQQSEVIEKIEDDVEAASTEVKAGHEEITNLYSIKKGNRPLILKVFGLLIFFIIFLRLYKKN